MNGYTLIIEREEAQPPPPIKGIKIDNSCSIGDVRYLSVRPMTWRGLLFYYERSNGARTVGGDLGIDLEDAIAFGKAIIEMAEAKLAQEKVKHSG